MKLWIRDVESSTFEDHVVLRSHEVPVLVDFWAAWCGPCRRLTPILEQVIDELRGRVELAKVDTDRNPELAARFQIRGIPAVKLFKDGQVAGEFVGAHDAGFVKSFLADWVASPAQEALAAAHSEPELRALFDDREVGTAARTQLAGLLLTQGRLDEIERVLAPLGDLDSARHLRERLAMARDLAAFGGEATARERLAANPADLDARWALAAALQARGDTAGALNELLEIVRRDRRYRQDGARKAMLALFDQLGPQHDLTRDFRRQLQIVT
jgi:putative thioredoxin